MSRISPEQVREMRTRGYITTREAAAALRQSSGNIARLARTHAVESRRVGGVVYVGVESLAKEMGDGARELLHDLLPTKH